MNMASVTSRQVMKNGMPYEICLCIDPETKHTAEFLKDQITSAIKSMSSRSRWLRFASPLNRLSDKQLDYLTNLDGKNRMAWCALIHEKNQEKGIGLSRYVKLTEENNVAEFAVTVVDEFQGQGVGYALLKKLIRSAMDNGITILRGYLHPDNKRMLALCKRLSASISIENTVCIKADIPVSGD